MMVIVDEVSVKMAKPKTIIPKKFVHDYFAIRLLWCRPRVFGFRNVLCDNCSPLALSWGSVDDRSELAVVCGEKEECDGSGRGWSISGQ